jgi:hypothetical protein
MLWVTCHPLSLLSPLSPLWRCGPGHVPVPSTPSLSLRGETVTTGGPWNLYTAEGAWTRLTCGGCPSEANVKYGCTCVVFHNVRARCGCLSPRPVYYRESLCYCDLDFCRQGMHSVSRSDSSHGRTGRGVMLIHSPSASACQCSLYPA